MSFPCTDGDIDEYFGSRSVECRLCDRNVEVALDFTGDVVCKNCLCKDCEQALDDCKCPGFEERCADCESGLKNGDGRYRLNGKTYCEMCAPHQTGEVL